MPLTDAACKGARPQAKAYKKTYGQGLYLHVLPTGGRYWRLKYRFLGKEKVLSLGVYPEVSLAEAREKKMVVRKLLADGMDPSSAKQDRRQLAEINATNTFEAVAREWHERNREKWTPAYAVEILHRLEMDIFPVIGQPPVGDISPLVVLNMLRKIENRGAGEMARRAGQPQLPGRFREYWP